jgi:hypothetical protein
MKIWLDIANPAEARFLLTIKNELNKSGHEIFITAREPSTPILELLEAKNYTIVKGHGKNLIAKAIKTPSRAVALIGRMPSDIDRSFSVESVSAAFASKLMGIKSVLFTDNEKARLQCYLGYNLADRIVSPNLIPRDLITNYFFTPKEIISVPGLKEQTYLKNFKPNKRILTELGISNNSKLIVIRPEPGLAAYSKNVQKNLQILISVCKKISKTNLNVKIVFIPRYAYQRNPLRQFKGQIIVPEKSIDTLSLIYYADWIVCAGDTMAREAILLGKPTIICYTGDLVAINKKLVESGAAFFSVNPDEIVNIISSDYKPSFEFIKTLKDPTESIMKAILKN